MKITKNQASKRLLKKLSALRATLSNQEREILDSIVGAEEVAAHKFSTKNVNKVATKAAQKNTAKNTEVAAHKFSTKNVNKVATKTTPRITFDPNTEEYKIRD